MIARITEVKTELLRMPLPRPMQSGSSSGKKGGPVIHINMPIVSITTEDGIQGLGYAWSLLGGATATRCVLRDDFAPLLTGEDALDHERLWHKLYKRLQSVGRHGLVTQAQAAVDLALWDIKGKISGLPVCRVTLFPPSAKGKFIRGPNRLQTPCKQLPFSGGRIVRS